jgi:endonuclease/exonuclease/phosphatase (EEP) superfamily protein YafD
LSELAGAVTFIMLGPIGLLLASFWPSNSAFIIILGSLRLHLALVALALAGLLVLIGGWRRGLAVALLVLAVFGQAALALLPHISMPTPDSATRLKVLSFNILHSNKINGGRIADYILSAKPDIAFIQESAPLRTHLDRLRTEYPYQIGCGTFTRACDSLLLSRTPLSKPDYYLSGSHAKTRFFTTEVSFGDRKLSLAAMHLTKAEFGAYQSYEYDEAATKIAALKDPVIAAGDFNTTSWAPRFIGFLDATGLMRAPIEPATWPGDRGLLNMLGLPIDHILVRGGAITRLETVPDDFGSNHRGLLAEIALPAP